MTSLIYVMGPSGAGKDSIMSYAKQRLSSEDRCVFAHRYITRPSDAGGENHIALEEQEFERRQKLGLFCMNWSSHGFHYGIGVEVETWLSTGLNVVMNGSRDYLSKAASRFPNLVPVLISVAHDVLRERLMARGRESESEIEKRIQRNQEFSLVFPNVVTIRNDGPLDEAGEMFLDLLGQKVVAVK